MTSNSVIDTIHSRIIDVLVDNYEHILNCMDYKNIYRKSINFKREYQLNLRSYDIINSSLHYGFMNNYMYCRFDRVFIFSDTVRVIIIHQGEHISIDTTLVNIQRVIKLKSILQ